MDKENRSEHRQQPGCVSQGLDSKKKWQQPKLTFIKPKLTKHGKLEEVTGQFFGGFTPPPSS